MTFPASQHKSCPSILTTCKNKTQHHQTHPIHCQALHQHRTTTTSTTANISNPNRHISATIRKTKTIKNKPKKEIEEIAARNRYYDQMQWFNNNNNIIQTKSVTTTTFPLTVFWISILAWYSPTSMRAMSTWPLEQAHIRAVNPSYQITKTTDQTNYYYIRTTTTANISDPNRHI